MNNHNLIGWVVVSSLDKVYEFNTFEDAFNFQLDVMGHLMTRSHFEHVWKPNKLKQH